MSNIHEYMAIKDALSRPYGMKVDTVPEIEVDCFMGNNTLVKTFDSIQPAMTYFFDNSRYYEMVIMYIRGVPVKRHYKQFRDIFLHGQTHCVYTVKTYVKGGGHNANSRETRKRIF